MLLLFFYCCSLGVILFLDLDSINNTFKNVLDVHAVVTGPRGERAEEKLL